MASREVPYAHLPNDGVLHTHLPLPLSETMRLFPCSEVITSTDAHHCSFDTFSSDVVGLTPGDTGGSVKTKAWSWGFFG